MELVTDAAELAEAGTSPSSSPSRPITNGRKRKRTPADSNQSPGSTLRDEDLDDAADEKLRSGTKRACNECRQQKLKCDVVPEPNFQTCSRCRRLKYKCEINPNFKRVGKRSKIAEMEREIEQLRKKLADKDSYLQSIAAPQGQGGYTATMPEVVTKPQPAPLESLHEGVAGSLLDLRHSSDGAAIRRNATNNIRTKRLDQVILVADQIDKLYQDYILFYHPFMPVLDTDKSPEYYYGLSPLLFWTIMVVAARRFEDDDHLLTELSSPLSQLIWSTVSAVPQNYHVVKALCILCTWPLPAKSTSTDPSFMLSGLMMQIALQTGLHRPSHVQDFSRRRVELREEDLRDRLKTWASCNIVAQAVSTANGQPPKAVYDYTLMSLSSPGGSSQQLPANLHWRLQIERFCDKVSQKFYNNRTDPIGITGDQERAAWTSLLIEDYRDLERKINASAGPGNAVSPLDSLHLQAANLHLRLSAFFDASSAPNYASDLMELYFAATIFLNSALALDWILDYATSYLMQMILASGFTLMKLLNSFFARHIDASVTRKLFIHTIFALRRISVRKNDLPARLAEVLAQLWKSSGAGDRSKATVPVDGLPSSTLLVDGSLQLKVRCRMSMSLVFDSVWRWREEFQFNGDGDGDGADGEGGATSKLDEAVNNPTNPELLSADRSANATRRNTPGPHGSELLPQHDIGDFGPRSRASISTGTVGAAGLDTTANEGVANEQSLSTPFAMGFHDYSYEVFDPMAWMLDGNLQFSYNEEAWDRDLRLDPDASAHADGLARGYGWT